MPPLPRAKRTDPAGLPLPADPRTWPEWRQRLRAHRVYLRPRPPFTEDEFVYCWNAADCVVLEVIWALNLRRFPRKQWIDWLCRRAEAFYRVKRRMRARFRGPCDREWLRVYMRNWLFTALRQNDYRIGCRLPPEMWAGHSPFVPSRASAWNSSSVN